MTLPHLPFELPDGALIRRFLDGDERAFRMLYERHTPRLKMTLQRLLGTRRQDIDDVVQDTWLAGCRGLHGYRGDAKFSKRRVESPSRTPDPAIRDIEARCSGTRKLGQCGLWRSSAVVLARPVYRLATLAVSPSVRPHS